VATTSALLFLPAAGKTADAVDETAALILEAQEDLRLAEQISQALWSTGCGPLRAVDVTVHGRFAVLAGRVPSYHLKQVGQETALAVPGVHHVQNDLDVVRPA
jgi:osmotically-inducible protein OsmY